MRGKQKTTTEFCIFIDLMKVFGWLNMYFYVSSFFYLFVTGYTEVFGAAF